ncbi:MAG: CvpA family protein [Campylobacterales bacterium]
MTKLDWILLGLALFFWFRGYGTGFKRELLTLAGVFAGFVLANNFYDQFVEWFMKLMDLDRQAASIVGYSFTLLGIWFLFAVFGVLFFSSLSSKAKRWERYGGAILSVFKFFAVGGAIVYLFSLNPYLKERWLGEIEKSRSFSIFYDVGDIVLNIDIKNHFREIPRDFYKPPKQDIFKNAESVWGPGNQEEGQ